MKNPEEIRAEYTRRHNTINTKTEQILDALSHGSRHDYTRGWIDCLNWVLNEKDEKCPEAPGSDSP